MSISVESKPNEKISFLGKEFTCTPASLRGHIVNAHFSPDIAALLGVARYDIELALYRGIQLDWVVRKAYERLEEDEATTHQRFVPDTKDSDFWEGSTRLFFQFGDIRAYREMIVKNLIYIEELRRASVDWVRVNAALPEADSVTLVLFRDSRDQPFLEAVAQAREKIRNDILEPKYPNRLEYLINNKGSTRSLTMGYFSNQKIYSKSDIIYNNYKEIILR